MQVNNVSYNPNFQAKLIISDERVQKYVKSAFMANSKNTINTLDKFSEIYPDSIVTVNIKKIKNRDCLFAKNGVTGATKAKLLASSEVLKLQDRTSFIDLIKGIMNKKSFWE